MKVKRKPHTWGSIFRNAVRRGDDHGYAAYLADNWEKRQKQKSKRVGKYLLSESGQKKFGIKKKTVWPGSITFINRKGQRMDIDGSLTIGELRKMGLLAIRIVSRKRKLTDGWWREKEKL